GEVRDAESAVLRGSLPASWLSALLALLRHTWRKRVVPSYAPDPTCKKYAPPGQNLVLEAFRLRQVARKSDTERIGSRSDRWPRSPEGHRQVAVMQALGEPPRGADGTATVASALS